MAVPLARPSETHSALNVALIAFCLLLGAASASRHEHLLALARTALDGLAPLAPPIVEAPDGADLPAMDPLLARVVDPRPIDPPAASATARRAPIQPFLYEPRPGDTLATIATRFGVSISALLWNNQLERPDEVPAGLRLSILPLNGVLHRVEAGETAAIVAERYGARPEELIRANALDDPSRLPVGRLLVVPGGAVPSFFGLQAADQATPEAELSFDPFDAGETPLARRLSVDALTARIQAAIAYPQEGLPRPPGATPSERDFILSLASAARESQRATGVPTSVTLAQAILESDWGRSRLAREANNLFGIKATTRPGTAGVYDVMAWEVMGGRSLVSPESFKAYRTLADSIVDHGRWFHQQPRYAGALAVRDNPRAFARAINAAGYATDPDYAFKLIALMDRFDLYAYDVE